MRIGVFISDVSGAQTDVAELLANARAAEALGFSTGWVPHIPWSLDGLTALALAGQVTNRIELGTAVMPTYPRHPMAMAQQAMSTQAAAGGRLVLGIGPSHPVVIENMFGLTYDRPVRHTREYVEVLRAAFAGAGQVEYRGEFFSFSSMLTVPGSTPRRSWSPRSRRGCCASRASSPTAPSPTGRTNAPSASTSCPASPRPPRRRTVRPHGSWSGCRSRSATTLTPAASGRRRSSPTYLNIPTYQRVLARGGDGTTPTDVAVIGTEAEVEARLRVYADAGATDLCATALGLDDDREASQRRTIELLASLGPEL